MRTTTLRGATSTLWRGPVRTKALDAAFTLPKPHSTSEIAPDSALMRHSLARSRGHPSGRAECVAVNGACRPNRMPAANHMNRCGACDGGSTFGGTCTGHDRWLRRVGQTSPSGDETLWCRLPNSRVVEGDRSVLRRRAVLRCLDHGGLTRRRRPRLRPSRSTSPPLPHLPGTAWRAPCRRPVAGARTEALSGHGRRRHQWDGRARSHHR